MDRFDAIAAFVAVAEHGGFAPAARRLGISTSAATRLVAALEQRLGVRLLNRTTRAVSLTDAGARFLERARRILADLEEAEQAAESERGAPAGRLHISAPLIFGRMHIAPLICEFMNLHPRVQAELHLTDRMVNLVEDGVDLALRIGHLGDSSDIVRRLGAARRLLVASPSYLAAAGTPSTPNDLAAHRLISCTALTAPVAWRFRYQEETQEIAVAPAYATNSVDAAIWHARQGGGLTFALSYQVVDDVRAGRLRPVLEAHEPAPYPVQFVYPSSRLLSLKVRALIDLASLTRNWTFLDVGPGA